jgi:hypothetical protein
VAIEAAIAPLPPHERIHLLLKVLMKQDSDQIPVTPDGRRLSSEVARARVALRRDRQPSDEAH